MANYPRANFRFSTTLFQPADDVTQTLYPNAVPTNVPCILLLDPKTANEEKVKVTAKTSNSLTVIRGYGGTTPKPHSLGATIVDYNNPEVINELADGFEAEHGAGGVHNPASVLTPAGAQTVTNKNFTSPTNTFPATIPNPVGSPAQGDILYYNGTNWVRLAPGTLGQFLKTNGAAANPEWANAAGGGSTPPRCRARRTSNQSTTTDTLTIINFDAEDFDNDTMHDTVTNNSRITIKTAGVYLIIAQVAFQTNGTGRRGLVVNTNGSSPTGLFAKVSHQQPAEASPADLNVISASGIGVYSVNDYIELAAYQNSGGAENALGGSEDYKTHLTAIYMGAAT